MDAADHIQHCDHPRRPLHKLIDILSEDLSGICHVVVKLLVRITNFSDVILCRSVIRVVLQNSTENVRYPDSLIAFHLSTSCPFLAQLQSLSTAAVLLLSHPVGSSLWYKSAI